MSRKFNMTVLTPEGLRAINDQIQQNPFDVAFDENAFQRYLSLANEALARFQDRQDLDIAKYIPSILFKGTPGRDNPLDFKNVSKTGNGIFYLTNIRSDLNRGLTPARLCGGSFSRFVKNINAQIGRDSQRVDANVGDSAVGWANALLTQLQKIFKPYIDIVGASNLADACVKFGSAKTYASLAEKQLVLPAGGKATLNSVVFADPEKKLRASQIYQSNPLKHRKGVSAAYLNIGKTKYPRTQGVFRNPRTGQIEVGSGCVTGQYVSDLALKGIRYKPKIRRPKFATKEEAGYYNQVSRQGLKKLIGKNKSIVRKYCKPMKDLSGFDPSMYENAARSATLAMRSGMAEQLAQQLAKPQNLRNPRPLEALPSLSRMQARNEARPRYYQTTVGKTVKNGYYGKNGWVAKGTPTKVNQRNPNMAKPFKAGSAEGIQDFAAKLQQRDGASRAQWFAKNGVTVPGNKK